MASFALVDTELLAVRRATYRLFAELGRAPTQAEVAARTDRTATGVSLAWRELHDEHALVLDSTGQIRMANPFSAIPTPYTVRVQGRSWFANCAWDAFGICAALHADGDIETACADCGAALNIHVRDEQPDSPSLLFHCLVPARSWWADIVFT